MKKFLIYVVVLIGVLFVGFTTYYFVQNKETFSLKIEQDSSMMVNVETTFSLEDILVHNEPHKDTQIAVSSASEDVVSYNPDTKTFLAKAGGSSIITITTTNKKFDHFKFTVAVGDGSATSPFYIKSASELAKIGTGTWDLTKSYQVISNIDLNTPDTKDWSPIGSTASFQGHFDGGNFSIYNLSVISTENKTYAGLFGSVGENGRVENICLVDAKINGDFNYAGLVAGVNAGKVGLIEIVNGSINNTNTNAITGGIVGLSEYRNSRSEVYMSSVDTLSLTSNGTVGGLIGKAVGNIAVDNKVNLERFTTNASSKAGGLIGENVSYMENPADVRSKYRFSVVRNNLAIVQQEGLTANVGALVGVNSDYENSVTRTNEYTHNYFSASGIQDLGVRTAGYETKLADLKSTEELKSQATYEGWDFKDVWSIEDTVSIAKINFANTYKGTSVYDPGNKVNTKGDLMNALNTIKDSPANDITYEIELPTDQVVTMEDFGVTKWTPIGTPENPFKGKLIVTGKSLTFKGFVIENCAYEGFFGYTDSPAEIRNVIFEDFTITNQDYTAEYAGTIVAYANSAIIENCKVVGVNINAAKVTGGAVGYIKAGSVNELTVTASGTENYANSISLTNPNNMTVGGVVGRNDASLSNIIASLELQAMNISINTSANVIIGGMVGENNSVATNLRNEAVTITEISAVASSYVGGVAGVNRKELISSFSIMSIEMKDTNTNTYVGGVVGVNEADSTVKYCFFNNMTIIGCRIGGVVARNGGVITECYSAGEVKGKFVGGIASETSGKINNCYTTSSLVGNYDDGRVSGISYLIHVGGDIQYVFSTASITGKGELSAESYSSFRGKQAFWLAGIYNNMIEPCGDLSNCLIINYGNAKIQSTGLRRPGWISCSEEDCKSSTNFKAFRDNNFSSDVWNFDIPAQKEGQENESIFPTLKNVYYEKMTEEVPEV